MLTKEMVERALPANLRPAVTQTLVDLVNNITTDPEAAQQVRDNFISYTGVLRDGKFKTEDYVHAVTYVSFKLMGHSNQEAYFKTFPQRHQALVARGTSGKDISAYVSAYARGKLVNLILEQSLVPSWVLNQDLYQQAINQQAWLMLNAKSEKVQSDAANSLLTHLAKPKESGPAINIDMRETSGIGELRNMLTQLAQTQRQAIAEGTSPQTIAAQRLIEGSQVIDVEPEPVAVAPATSVRV
jgi:hypothetical protein